MIELAREYEDKAPVQAMVLEAFKNGPMTVGQLATTLGKDKGQISNICSALVNDRKITRPNRSAPYSLVETELLT